MSKKNVGIKIKEAIKEAGYTQSAFEKKIGIGENLISRWVSGDRNPSLTSIKKIAQATGKPLYYFFDNSTNSKGNNNSIIVGQNSFESKHDLELLKKDIEILKKENEFIQEKVKDIIIKKENHTYISNELLKNLTQIPLTSFEYRIIFSIMNSNTDISSISKAILIKESVIQKILLRLQKLNIIILEKETNQIKINRQFDLWTKRTEKEVNRLEKTEFLKNNK